MHGAQQAQPIELFVDRGQHLFAFGPGEIQPGEQIALRDQIGCHPAGLCGGR